MLAPKLNVVPTPADVAQAAADLIVEQSNRALLAGEKFSLVLSGGRTPEALFKLLASEPYKSQVDWPRVEIYFADERPVPPDHRDSNYRMAHEHLLSKVPIPLAQIHRMRGELDPQQAAIEYGQLLKAKFGDGGPDLILLGMGDDGHTASLFPHTKALEEPKHRAFANYVEKLKLQRITMTAPFINRARTVAVLITGADKAARVREVLEEASDPMRLPIQLIQPASGELIWILDTAAAGMT